MQRNMQRINSTYYFNMHVGIKTPLNTLLSVKKYLQNCVTKIQCKLLKNIKLKSWSFYKQNRETKIYLPTLTIIKKGNYCQQSSRQNKE